MILTGWHVDGFGVHRGQRAEGLGDGTCVVYGPNEAGKSTLLSFLRYVLFGPAGASPVPALRGGRTGGRVFLRAAGPGEGIWTVERYADRKPPAVADPAGRPAGPEDLARLLGGVDAGLFNSVFAFSLVELSRFESLAGTAVRDQIFSAGITGAGVTASQARRHLEAARLALLRPRTTRARINGLAADLKGIRRDLAAAERVAAGYPDVLREEGDADRTVAALGAEIGRLDREDRLLEALIQIWDPWNRWREANEELAAIPATRVGPHGRAAMAETRKRRELAEQQLSGLEGRARDLQREADAIRLDPGVEALAERALPTVAGLGEQRARRERLAELGEHIRGLGERLRKRLADLGGDWTFERLDAFDFPAALAEEALEWKRRIEEEAGALLRARARAEDADAETRLADEAAAGLRQAASRLAAHPTRQEIEVRRERIDAIERRLPWLRSAPAWLALLLAGSLSLAAFGAWSGGPAGWTAVALGVLAALAALTTWGRSWSSERRAVLASAAELGIAGPLHARGLDAARQRLRLAAEGARAREDAETRLRAAIGEAERAARKRDDLRARTGEAQARTDALLRDWDGWRRGHGLPEHLAPQGLPAFIAALRTVRDASADLQRARQQAAAVEEAAAAWRTEARSVLEAAGRVPPDGDALVHTIERLAVDVQAALDARRSCDDLHRRLSDLAPEVAAAREELAQADADHRAVLAEAGAADDAEHDELVERTETREKKQAEINHLWEGIAAQLGPGEYGQRLRERLESGGPADWAAERAGIAARLRQAAAERDAAIEARTRAGQRRRQIEESADIPALANRERALAGELAAAVRQWRRLRLAESLIDRALGRFVRDRQPEVLAFASQAFAAVTGGRYRRVVQDASAADSLAVVDAAGARIEPGRLSRGTEEQLYLALRLGLAESFARRAASLPLVLDDALVNFDPERTTAMMQAIARYLAGGGRQVLLFTCHPEIRDLTLELFPGRPVVELASAAGG